MVGFVCKNFFPIRSLSSYNRMHKNRRRRAFWLLKFYLLSTKALKCRVLSFAYFISSLWVGGYPLFLIKLSCFIFSCGALTYIWFLVMGYKKVIFLHLFAFNLSEDRVCVKLGLQQRLSFHRINVSIVFCSDKAILALSS